MFFIKILGTYNDIRCLYAILLSNRKIKPMINESEVEKYDFSDTCWLTMLDETYNNV